MEDTPEPFFDEPDWTNDGFVALEAVIRRSRLVVLLEIGSVINAKSRYLARVVRTYKGHCGDEIQLTWGEAEWHPTEPPDVGDLIWVWQCSSEDTPVYTAGVLKGEPPNATLEIGTDFSPYRFVELEDFRLVDEYKSIYPWTAFESLVIHICQQI